MNTEKTAFLIGYWCPDNIKENPRFDIYDSEDDFVEAAHEYCHKNGGTWEGDVHRYLPSQRGLPSKYDYGGMQFSGVRRLKNKPTRTYLRNLASAFDIPESFVSSAAIPNMHGEYLVNVDPIHTPIVIPVE